MSIEISPEVMNQQILAGIILVGRLGVTLLHPTRFPPCPRTSEQRDRLCMHMFMCDVSMYTWLCLAYMCICCTATMVTLVIEVLTAQAARPEKENNQRTHKTNYEYLMMIIRRRQIIIIMFIIMFIIDNSNNEHRMHRQ